MGEASGIVEKFFRDLENPELYERIDEVPIFCKSIRRKKATDGTWHVVEVDESDLNEIAQNVHRMEFSKGVLPVITPGHRMKDPKLPEEDKPAVWGYGRNFRPGSYTTPSGQRVQTLLSTWYLSKKERAKDGRPANEAARSFPFRSVDYYADSNEISGIALLRSDPELDLGLISYGHGRPLFHYATENDMPGMPMNDPTMPPDVNVDPNAGMGELSPEEQQQAQRYMAYFEKSHPAFKFMCDQYAATMGGAGAPGGAPASGAGSPMPGAAPAPASISPTNTSLPDEAGDPDEFSRRRQPVSTTNTTPANTPVVDQDVRARLAQYERERASDRKLVEDLKKQLDEERQGRADAEKASRLTQYHSELEALSSEYEMDVAQEKADVEHLTPAQFRHHVDNRIKKHYRENPTARRSFSFGREAASRAEEPTVATIPGKRPNLSDAQWEQVFQYQRENPNTDTDRAVSAVFGKK